MNRLRRLALVLFGLCAPLLLVELAATAWELSGYGVRSVDGQPAGLYLPREPGALGGPKLRPGAHLRGLRYEVTVNADGFRGPALTRPFPDEGLRVWALGGSTTFDIYAPDDARTWPGQLEARLRDALPGTSVEVVNAGVPGEVALGNADTLRARGPELRPDYVVLYVGPNDLRDLTQGNGRVGAPPPPGLLARMPPLRSLLWLDRWRLSRGYGAEGLPATPPDDHARAEMRRRLALLTDAVAAVGARPVYASHALRIAPGATGEALRAQAGELPALLGVALEVTLPWFDAWNAVAREAATGAGAPFADVRAAVGPEDENWGDATHFAEVGSRRATEPVAAAILADRERTAGR